MVTRGHRFAQQQTGVAAACAAVLALFFGGMLALHNLGANVVATIALALAAGAAYFVALYALEKRPDQRAAFWLIVAGGLLFRVLLFATPATLSEDVHRYRWEGRVQLAGWNPYSVKPDDVRIARLGDDGWSKMPGREVATVYPPLLMLAFRETSRWLDALALERQALLYKLPFLGADLLVLGLLAWRLRGTGQGNVQLAVYAWNPLVIVEFAGSGHMDPLAMAALLCAVLLLERNRALLSTALLGAGVLLKVFPLVLAPLWLRRAGWPRSGQAWQGLAAALGLAAACWWPFRGAEAQLLESLAYVESRWQLNNASLYALLRWVSGSHDVAAGVGAGVVVALALWVATRNWDPVRGVLLLVSVIPLLSANAFSWYFTWAIPFLCLLPLGRFSLAWLLLTVTQFLSYHVLIHYHALGVWQFQPFFLWLTYGPFFVLLVLLGRVNPAAQKPSI